MAKIQGIYSIIHIPSGRTYIGSSRNVKRRISAHRNDLKNNRHSNHILQNYYNKYGENVFSFNILFSVFDVNILIDIENEFIASINESKVYDALNFEKVFNTQWAGKTGCIDPSKYKKGPEHHLYGKTGYNKGKIFSDEVRKNMSNGQKGKISGHKGKRMSDTSKNIISSKKKGVPWTQARRDAHNRKI